MLCSACGDACKSCPGGCKAICGPISQAFKGCGGFVKHFFERPLSAYIIVSFAVSGYALFSASGDMTPAGCSSTFLKALMGFAVINILFSIYVQYAVWQKIESFKDGDANGEETAPDLKWQDGDEPVQDAKGGALGGLRANLAARGVGGNAAAAPPVQEGPKPGYWIVPGKVVQESFKHVFQVDLVVLAMFVGLLVMCGLTAYSPEALDGKDNACKVQDSTKSLGYSFFAVAATWSFLYLCCTCCSGSVTVAKDNNQYDEIPPA